MIIIRELTPSDEAQWRKLWAGYLEFYETSLADAVSAEIFRRLLGDARYFARAAADAEQVVGIVHCIFHPVTGSINDRCYLEDLFVDAKSRGAGAGRKLIEAVYAQADKRGCERVYWNTAEDNIRARKLYDNLASLTNFVQYRR